MQKTHRAEQLPHTEYPPIGKGKGAGRDEILGGQPGGGQPVPEEVKRFLPVHMEDAVQQAQAVQTVHGGGGHTQAFEVVDDIHFDALQPGLRRLDAVRAYAKGEVFRFGQAVVPLGKLVLQHFGILPPHIVKPVRPEGNGYALCPVLGGGQIQKRELKVNGAVKIVEEIGPALKDCCFVLVLTELVVNILKLDSFGIEFVGHTADAVRPHPFIGDAVLGGQLLFIRPLRPGNRGFDLLAFAAGQFSLLG